MNETVQLNYTCQ